jgi:hypothetical protein
MSQYWLKSLGPGRPRPEPISDDWVSELGLDDFELATGPATNEKPPQMGLGDSVLLHAPAERRIFAEGKIVGPAAWRPDRPGGDRWPWVYACRIEIWVPLVKDGPPTAEVAPKAAVERLEAGGGYAPLSRPEHDAIRGALLAQPTVRTV